MSFALSKLTLSSQNRRESLSGAGEGKLSAAESALGFASTSIGCHEQVSLALLHFLHCSFPELRKGNCDANSLMLSTSYRSSCNLPPSSETDREHSSGRADAHEAFDARKA